MPHDNWRTVPSCFRETRTVFWGARSATRDWADAHYHTVLCCSLPCWVICRPVVTAVNRTVKPGFHYLSWRPEITARVDGWRAFPLAELTGNRTVTCALHCRRVLHAYRKASRTANTMGRYVVIEVVSLLLGIQLGNNISRPTAASFVSGTVELKRLSRSCTVVRHDFRLEPGKRRKSICYTWQDRAYFFTRHCAWYWWTTGHRWRTLSKTSWPTKSTGLCSATVEKLFFHFPANEVQHVLDDIFFTAQYLLYDAVSVCLSVRLSVCHTRVSCRNNRAHHQAISTEF